MQINSDLTSTIKDRAITVLSNLRYEREITIRHLSKISTDFNDFLNRPDPRQEYINNWQIDYNSVTFDLRQDDEVKCELHQRFIDLRGQLWEISDQRKIEAEKERESLMMNGWIKDRFQSGSKNCLFNSFYFP
jgi:hypothetical protein